MIFVAGGEQLSSSHTAVVLRWIFRLVQFQTEHFETIHAGLRKVGHFVAYAFLSLLLFRAWRATVNGPLVRFADTWIRPAWRLRWALLALGVTAVVAAGDEFHQFFVPGRFGTYRDVILDCLGALFAQALLLAWFYRKPRAE